MSMNIKAIVAGVVGVLACASAARSQQFINGLFVCVMTILSATTCYGDLAYTNVALHKPVSAIGGFGTSSAALASLNDGAFRPRNSDAGDGTVYWNGLEPTIYIELNGTFDIVGAIVQSDDNDAYILEYRDSISSEWKRLWDVPNYDNQGAGMQTRPNPENDAQIQFLPVVRTDSVRFRAANGDNTYSVSEIQVFAVADSDYDGIPDNQDNCTTVANPDQADCDHNGLGDACQSGNTDCNANGIPDYCDIASGTSADADSNGVPDSCQPDCNLNNLPDAWEIATGRATDYNVDGIPDTCQGAAMVDSTTDNLGAPSGLTTREHIFAALPFAESAVDVVIDLVGDLNRVNEYVEVSLNGGAPRRFFEADGNDCPATPDRAVITLTRAEFNALISANGATNSLTVALAGSAGVDPSECKNAALTQFRLRYVGIQPKSGDCNGNQRLDVAETFDGTTPDCNANTVPDSCDIARGAAQDCNSNGVPDACELTATPAIDCDGNGVIDTCDLATGGTSVDCDQNGRIDSCQVTETPGTDCNGNLRPDACDIAGGTSGDIDQNATPDECQTVTVPGEYAGIQAAIDAAPLNEMRIISVAAGTYAGPIAFNGKPVIVRGAGAASTVLEGNGGQQLSVVRFTGGEPAIAALERVTVRGGTTGSPIPGSPTVIVGGGIFGLDSAASIRDCIVEQNAGGFGGGGYFLRCSGEVRGTTFRNNNASADGGGFQSNLGTQRLTDVVIEGNVCNSRGGGMHLVQGNPALTRVTVRNNYSNNLIGGVSWFALGSATATAMLDDCTVTGNSALVTQGGIGISAPTSGTPTITLRGTEACDNAPRPNVSGPWADLGGNVICDCAGDLTFDGVVNGADLGILLSAWGACGGSCASDLNRDGVVNGADLGAMLSQWGACGN